MSVAPITVPPTGAAPAPVPGGHYGFGGVVRSEWTKMRSVRSTVWSLAILVVASIGIGALVTAVTASHYAHLSLQDRLTYDPTARSLTGTVLGQLAIGVLGALVVTGEYGTGSIRSTLAAVPRRPWVLQAKALVFGAVALVVSEITAVVAFVVGQAILSGRAPTASFGQPGVLRGVLFDGVYLMLVGLLALGIGFLFRHTAAAITGFVVVLLILPAVVQALPTSVVNVVQRFMPSNLGMSMVSVRSVAHSFDPVVSLVVLVVYVVVVLAIATVLLVRRDA